MCWFCCCCCCCSIYCYYCLPFGAHTHRKICKTMMEIILKSWRSERETFCLANVLWLKKLIEAMGLERFCFLRRHTIHSEYDPMVLICNCFVSHFGIFLLAFCDNSHVIIFTLFPVKRVQELTMASLNCRTNELCRKFEYVRRIMKCNIFVNEMSPEMYLR